MLHRFSVSIIVLVAAVIFSAPALAQSERPQPPAAAKGQRAAAAAAPRHDISGTWEPANGTSDGIQANGVKAMPNDGKPQHQLPFTPYGSQTYKSHHALEGADAVLPGFFDDPRDKCEPLGFPRMNFYNLRETQILQNEYKIVMLYQYGTVWRVIWTSWSSIVRPWRWNAITDYLAILQVVQGPVAQGVMHRKDSWQTEARAVSSNVVPTFVLALCGETFSGPLLAHHRTAALDTHKRLTLNGTVTE